MSHHLHPISPAARYNARSVVGVRVGSFRPPFDLLNRKT
jgi:hypothetical protein